MNNKYQIFVSSTYIDLKDQRDLVIKAILEMGHIPVGMEMFSAADEEQWSIIKKQIDQSDYYVVILAGRYGSTTDEGISYTEKEYDYAVSQGIPALGFVLDSAASWPTQHTDTEPNAVSSLNLFKEKVQQKHVSYWKNIDDLYGKCSIALMKAFTAYPREGWVRASQYTDTKLTSELARLSSENAKLREQIDGYNIQEKEDHLKEIRENIKILRSNERQMYIWYAGGNSFEEVDSTTLFSLFLCIAPEILVENSLEHISRYVAQMICNVEPSDFRYEFPVPSNSVKGWLADFSTLGLVKPSDKKKPVADKNEYWSLTEKGKELLSHTRRVLLERASEKHEKPEETKTGDS